MGNLHKKYHITKIDLESLWDFQGGICPICKKDIFKDGLGMDTPCIDHDHSTGAVRGIIHSRCNLMLGYAGDDIMILEGAIQYLRNPPTADLFSADFI